MTKKPTEPSRQRDGKPFAGGKKLRKAFAALSARQNLKPNKPGYRMPGSMKK